jgi:hypothetical protein
VHAQLIVISGPDRGRAISLAEGQTLIIGRGESRRPTLMLSAPATQRLRHLSAKLVCMLLLAGEALLGGPQAVRAEIDRPRRLEMRTSILDAKRVLVAAPGDAARANPGVAYGLWVAATLGGPWFQAAGNQQPRWDKYYVPPKVRRGSMLPITRKQYDALVDAFGGST